MAVQDNGCISKQATELLLLNSKKNIRIIDVRDAKEYDEKHIPGAIHVPLSRIECANEYFAKTDFLITVCGKGGGRSQIGAERLRELGFKHSAWLCGGTLEWFRILNH